MLDMTRRMSQMLGFLILVSMAFLLLSIGSYSTDDPTWNYYTSRESGSFANYGGVVGAFVADWGLQLFGTTVFVLIGCAAVSAVCLLRARVRLILAAAGHSLLLLGPPAYWRICIGWTILTSKPNCWQAGPAVNGLLNF